MLQLKTRRQKAFCPSTTLIVLIARRCFPSLLSQGLYCSSGRSPLPVSWVTSRKDVVLHSDAIISCKLIPNDHASIYATLVEKDVYRSNWTRQGQWSASHGTRILPLVEDVYRTCHVVRCLVNLQVRSSSLKARYCVLIWL